MSSKIFEGVLRFKQRLITETNLIFIAEPFRRFTVIVQCFYEQRKLRVVFQNEFSAADDLFQEGRGVALLIMLPIQFHQLFRDDVIDQPGRRAADLFGVFQFF